MRFELRYVHYIPKDLEPDVMYVSKEFGAAAHLCPCGCGTKIRTPLGPTEWNIEETESGPTLRPSVGNWQQACQSHYWIDKGEVKWADQWTSEQIVAGRQNEERRRQVYYETLDRQRKGIFRRFWTWVKELWSDFWR